VEKALKSSDCVLFIATEKSVASEKVLNEVYYALDENKRILPAVFHNCPIPFQLRRLQRIDFAADYNTGFRRLLKALGLKETDAASTLAVGQNVSAKPVQPDSAASELKAELPKPEPLRTMQEVTNVEPTVKQENTEALASASAMTYLPEDQEKGKGSKRTLFWGLGALAAALLIFILVRNSSSEEKNNDDTRLLSEQKPVDSSTFSSQTNDGTRPDTTTSTTPGAKTENGDGKSSTNNAGDGQKKFEAYKQAGINNFNNKNYKDAINDFTNALKLGNDAEVYFYTARSYGQMEDYSSAIPYYTKAIRLAPDKAAYWGSRGLAYRNNKDYKAALHDFDQVVSLTPNDGQPYNNRGTVKQLMNDLTGACQDFATAAKLNHRPGQINYDTYCGPKGTDNNPKIQTYKVKIPVKQQYKKSLIRDYK
jgi:tetratricopeptide (TPR) repeat protein